ncbi:hypothetical protein F4776DRAFT_438323 [Hypoxylon sp. NC0597]|nr:hypothetical protein F4776DRAFT_438323 [Hypoxylon sp. NC0597]
MAIETLHERDFGVLSRASKMKTTLQKPEIGSTLVKKESMYLLGNGLSEILCDQLDSTDPSREFFIFPSNRARTGSTSTASTSTSITNLSPSTSNAKSPINATDLSSSDETGGSYLIEDDHDIIMSDVQHCELHQPSLAEGLSRIPLIENAETNDGHSHDGGLLPALPVAIPHAHPLPSTSAHLGPAEFSTRPKTGERFIFLSGRDEILSRYFDGTLSLVGAKYLANILQDWDLLEALDRKSAVEEQLAAQDDASYPQQRDAPVADIRPAETSADFVLNSSYTRTPSTPSSPVNVAYECLFYKLMSLSKTEKPVTPDADTNIHVFVDMSNIFIGLCDTIKAARQIPRRSRITAPTFSFKVLSLVLERGREVKKRILAGSMGICSAKDHRSNWPEYFLDAEKLGYTMNIFSRVQKRKPKRRGRTPPDGGYLSAEDSIGDDGMAVEYEVGIGEQGVDENLHLNMMNSMWDHLSCPGTMVLATGDAAEAEFSGGFLQYAARALDKGWKFELVTWKRAMSFAWINMDFLRKYDGRFRVIFLDDFLQELQTRDLF